MAINPINLNPAELKVPQVDMSWLANLPNTFQQGQANRLKIDEGQRRQGALAALAGLDPKSATYATDLMKNLVTLDPSAAVSLFTNQQTRQGQLDLLKSVTGEGASTPAIQPQPPPPPAVIKPAAPAAAVTPPAGAPGPAASLGGTDLPVFAQPGGGGTTAAGIAPQLKPQSQQPAAPIFAGSVPVPGFTGFVTASNRPKVSYEGVNQDLMQSLNEVGNKLGTPLQITSARDSGHTPGSQHYGGEAADIRNRNLSQEQQQAIIAGLRAKGLNVLLESDHIHASLPRSGGAGGTFANLAGARAPGTVAASLQGRGPTGAPSSYQTAALNQALTANPAVASDISPTPLARTTAAGQAPASVANPAGQQPQPAALPFPTPLSGALPPMMNLAALAGGGGGPGGVGTIGPIVSGPASPTGEFRVPQGPQPTQIAQASQAGPTPPLPPPRPVVAQAQPAPQPTPVLPPQPPQGVVTPKPPVPEARGAIPNAPMSNYSDKSLQLMAMSPYASDGMRTIAAQEIARRSSIADEERKQPDIMKYNLAVRRGDWNNPDGSPKPFTDFLEKFGGGQKIQIGSAETEFQKKSGGALAERFSKISEEGDVAAENNVMLGGIRALGVKTGWEAAIKGKLAELGIDAGGSAESAYSAMIDKMTPQQRPSGAGATSDFDARMYKSALPGLMRLPGGNEIIMNQMEALQNNRIERARIAELAAIDVKDGGITKTAAIQQLAKLRTEARQIGIDAVKLSKAVASGAGGGGATLAPPSDYAGTKEDWDAGVQKYLTRPAAPQ